MTEMKFNLVRPAKAKGGDRYEHGKEGDADWMVIYVPQSLSREGGQPKKSFTVKFNWE